MWKFKASLKLPFWTRENQNKPTKNIFDKWINENMKEIDVLSFNFISFLNATFNSNFEGYKYIEITNSDNENDKRYYFVDSIAQTGSANTYKMNCSLDIYSSYTINFIEANKNKEFIFLRQHKYTKEALQIDDANFTAIPKIYENFTFEKIPFNNIENTNIWYGENLAIEGEDLLNANKYYVFKDGVNGGYKFFPILSKSKNVKIYSTTYERGELIYNSTFINGRFGNQDAKIEISDEINSKVREAYENNNVVVYRRSWYQNKYVFPANRADFGGYADIYNVPFGTMPIDIVSNSNVYNNAGAGLKTFELTQYVLGNQIAHYKQKNITSSWHNYSYDQAQNQALTFELRIFKGIPKKQEKEYKNSIDGLEEYRKNENNINKFLGIY